MFHGTVQDDDYVQEWQRYFQERSDRIQIRDFVCQFPIFADAVEESPPSSMLTRLLFLKRFFQPQLLNAMDCPRKAKTLVHIESEELKRVLCVFRRASGGAENQVLKRLMVHWPHLLLHEDSLNNLERNIRLVTTVFPKTNILSSTNQRILKADFKKNLSKFLFAEIQGMRLTQKVLGVSSVKHFCERLGCAVEVFEEFRNVVQETSSKQRVKSLEQ